jgi:hypothetical protein
MHTHNSHGQGELKQMLQKIGLESKYSGNAEGN